MTWTLWRWYPGKDDWEFVTQATVDPNSKINLKRKVMARHKRHDSKNAKFKWTATETKPRRFRTREKKEK